jgi:hypothetical protein
LIAALREAYKLQRSGGWNAVWDVRSSLQRLIREAAVRPVKAALGRRWAKKGRP